MFSFTKDLLLVESRRESVLGLEGSAGSSFAGHLALSMVLYRVYASLEINYINERVLVEMESKMMLGRCISRKRVEIHHFKGVCQGILSKMHVFSYLKLILRSLPEMLSFIST